MSDEVTHASEPVASAEIAPPTIEGAADEASISEPVAAEAAPDNAEATSGREGHEAEHESSSGGRHAVDEPHEDLPARGEDPRPYIVLTAIHDANARIAAITLSHADAWERAQKAAGGKSIAGMDLVEFSVPPRAFTVLREKMQLSADTVAVYDLFPLAAHLGRTTRKVAGQFLAAEILWALEEQGILAGIPLNIRLDVPRSWGDRSPKSVHEKLMEGGALDLTEAAIEDFRAIKGSWDQVS